MVDDGRAIRRFARRDAAAPGGMTFACGGEQPEIVHGLRDAMGWRLTGIEVSATVDLERVARLDFAANGTFAIGIGTRDSLIAGQWRQETPDAFVLRPSRPTWASSRPVTVAMREYRDHIVVRTTIG